MKTISAATWIHLTLAFLWVYQGLVPKVLFINADEIAVWQYFGLSHAHAILAGQAAGIAEIIFGILFLRLRHPYLHYLNLLGLFGLLILIALLIPSSLIAAFNPVTMNIAMMSLSVVYLALQYDQKLEFSVQKTESSS